MAAAEGTERPQDHPRLAKPPVLLPRSVKAVNEVDDKGCWGPGQVCVSVTYFTSFAEG